MAGSEKRIDRIIKNTFLLKLKPNTVSFFALLTAFFSGYLFYSKNVLLAGFFLLLSGILDIIDGSIARLTDNVTRFGDFLDHVLDRYSDFVVLAGITFSGLVSPILGFLAMSGVFMTNYTWINARVQGLNVLYAGFVRRSVRVIITSLFCVIYLFDSNALNYLMILFAVLGNAVSIYRVIAVRRILQ